MARRTNVLPHSASARDEARARIVAAARRYFFAHGFRGVTMDDLAEELGMSKKTLYQHFSSKPALVKAVLNEKLQQADEELGSLVASAEDDFEAALERVLACVQRHTEEIQPSFLRDMQRDDPDLFGIVDAKRRTMIETHFGKLFSDGRKSGLLRKDISVNILIEVLLAAVRGVMNPSKLMQLGITPRAGYAAIMSILLQGALRKSAHAEEGAEGAL